MTINDEGRGDKALMVWPLTGELFFFSLFLAVSGGTDGMRGIRAGNKNVHILFSAVQLFRYSTFLTSPNY